ncbi:hypothetical protein PGTUg99_005828 [Puccinia graminis f. sp. tritici]|uniref:Uncharacterized protein n=1 Tax=Puccinia graminis f. sp. tritici TaxID=56615 RepID=A0A5B0NT68_PUCGR|nr:hypothetical protein PGTUg99_005828 [Puccinia graminis f. sp. tritici]
MASPGSRPSPAPSTPGSQAPAASPAAAINPATKKKEITAVQAAKAKAMNVFTSDGSFLERFKKMKEEEVEKKKQEDALARKQAFEQRIVSDKPFFTFLRSSVIMAVSTDTTWLAEINEQKNRGKRAADPNDSISTSKKSKTEEEDNAYLREVRKLQGHSLRDEGAGVRALVK